MLLKARIYVVYNGTIGLQLPSGIHGDKCLGRQVLPEQRKKRGLKNHSQN
jgi:hypothetical protein